MATAKPRTEMEIAHEEQHHEHVEHADSMLDVKGHDFSVDTEDLPKGYFRSATFLVRQRPCSKTQSNHYTGLHVCYWSELCLRSGRIRLCGPNFSQYQR
jgi:hypothetical protein